MANLNLIGTTPAVKWCGSALTAIGGKIPAGTGFWLLGLLISEDGNRAIGTVTMHNRRLRIDDAGGHTHPDFCKAFKLSTTEKVCSAAVEYSEDNLKKTYAILKGKKVYSLATPFLVDEKTKKPFEGVQFHGGKLVDVIKTAMIEPLPERKGKKAGTGTPRTKKLEDMSPDELKAQQKLIAEKIKQATAGKGNPNPKKDKVTGTPRLDLDEVANTATDPVTDTVVDPAVGDTAVA